MPKISQTETNARFLPVKHVIKKLGRWTGISSYAHRRSLMYEISNGQEMAGDSNRFCTSVYDTANETLVHMTKAPVIWPNGAETGGCYNDNVTVMEDHVELKMAFSKKCLKEGHYDTMMNNNEQPVILFIRNKSDSEYTCAGKIQYIAGSFVQADHTCTKKGKHDGVGMPQPTVRFRMVDVTADMMRTDPSILCLPKK